MTERLQSLLFDRLFARGKRRTIYLFTLRTIYLWR